LVPLDQRSENESSAFQACAIDANCVVKPDGQHSVISKWLLPELSLSDRWSRGTRTLGTRLVPEVWSDVESRREEPVEKRRGVWGTFFTRTPRFQARLVPLASTNPELEPGT